ncbi:MAG: hypothetical protein ABJP33_05940 [Pseudoruegeria sp.]
MMELARAKASEIQVIGTLNGVSEIIGKWTVSVNLVKSNLVGSDGSGKQYEIRVDSNNSNTNPFYLFTIADSL